MSSSGEPPGAPTEPATRTQPTSRHRAGKPGVEADQLAGKWQHSPYQKRDLQDGTGSLYSEDMGSDASVGGRPTFAGGNGDLQDRTGSLYSEDMGSDASVGGRPTFAGENRGHPVSSVMSMKSDDSVDRSIKFRKEDGVNNYPGRPAFCDVSGCQSPAVKSCVTCGDSYCRTCITPHYTDPDLERHQLQDIQQRELPCATVLPPPGQLQFSKVSPDSVTLRWSPPEGAPGPHRYTVTWRRGKEQRTFMSPSCEVEVTGLHPGQRYLFSVATLSQDGHQSTPVEGFIHTELPAPQNLSVAVESSGVTLKWTKPEGVDQVSYLLELFREDQEGPPRTIHTDAVQHYISDVQHGRKYTVQLSIQKNNRQSEPISRRFTLGADSVYTESTKHVEACSRDITGLKPEAGIYIEERGGHRNVCDEQKTGLSDLLSLLGLRDLQGGKLTLSSVLEINSNTLSDTPPQGLQQLPWTFLRTLIMSNLNARNIMCEQDQSMHSPCSTEYVDSDSMNPLDLITALFHCADPFLQQEMVSKMSLCQFAVPLLLPNCDTQQSTLMLWPLRDLVKHFKHQSSSGSIESVVGRLVERRIPMVSFARAGWSSLSKSKTLNDLLSNQSQSNKAFVHSNMPCGDVPRRISDGLVEVSWYLPCGRKSIDIFTQPVAFANLRGDSRSFEAQVSFLCQTSAAVFIFSDDLEGDDLSPFTITESKAELFLVTNSQRKDYNVEKLRKICRKHNIEDTHVLLRQRQNDAKFVKSFFFRVEKIINESQTKSNMIDDFVAVAKQNNILVDENSHESKKGKCNAEEISKMVKDVMEFKEEQLPLHGAIWKEISQLEREKYRMRNANREKNIEQYRDLLVAKEQELRRKQHMRQLSTVMDRFIAGISQPKPECLYFLTWLRIQLDTFTRQNLFTLRQQYKNCCSQNPQDKELIKSLDEQMSNSSLGPEHFFRELGQMYECACSLPQHHQARNKVQHLPRLCAQMLLDGFPVELLDGDASNIPMKWISAVLTELHQLVDTKSRILVLTVLGVQSTGKSTLLNTMFGVQFAVSSGRCTRGAFMLLIKVSEELRPELNCDFIMLIDTEGLKSPELTALDMSYEHDNELATLVIGLSDITIINVAMENNQEMKDVIQIVVHAFLRMKEVGKKPRCLFVHQNVSDTSAYDNSLRDRNKLVEQLNKMTQAAAKIERKEANTKFTDVMQYDPEKDSYYIPGLWHGTPPMAPVNAGYIDDVYELKRNLINLLKSDEVRCNDVPTFLKWTNSLLNAVKFENFIFNFRNSLVADAYSDLCTKYNNWEWKFQSEMNRWLIAKTTVVSNFGMTEKNVQIIQLQTILKEMLDEASVKLDKAQQTIKDHLHQYFQQKDNNVRLIEKYRQEFQNSVNCLKQETERSIKHCLKQAVEIRKGKEKVNKIKAEQTDTIATKVLALISQCRGRNTDLSEGDLKTAFDQMWSKTISELSDIQLQQTDVYKNAAHLLKENLWEKGGRVSEMLSKVNLKTSGQGVFNVYVDRVPETNVNVKEIQDMCNQIITKCRTLVENHIVTMRKNNTDYNDIYTKELLKTADDKIKKIKVPDECEASLKFYIIGFAASDFQKAHDEFISHNDPQECLKQSETSFRESFLSLFYEKDHCLKRAEDFTNNCVKPAVQDYVSRHLGQAVASAMKTGDEEGVIYNTRTNFQFAMLKQLIEEMSFEKYKKYTTSYEAFVKDWMMQIIVQRMSANGQLPHLEKQLLSDIVKKINHAITSSTENMDIKEFIQQFCSVLQDQLVIPRDALDNFMILVSAKTEQFASNLKEYIMEMEASLAQEYDRRVSMKCITERIGQLPTKPHDLLFFRLCGCGHQCPFCKTPCEAGGQGHTTHFSNMHRPGGFGLRIWERSKKLETAICTTSVISDVRFMSLGTKGEWHPYKEYRAIYPDWDIAGDASVEASYYWKYVMKEFNSELAEAHNANPADIPDGWKKLTKQDALTGLKKAFNIE